MMPLTRMEKQKLRHVNSKKNEKTLVKRSLTRVQYFLILVSSRIK
jgi:hypothetical protein